mgnify:CR=1 FL=1
MSAAVAIAFIDAPASATTFTVTPGRYVCRNSVGSTHTGPGLEDAAPSARVELDDLQLEVLEQLCAGRRRGFNLRRREVLDELALLSMAEPGARGWVPTPAGRDLIGPTPQRWAHGFRLPSRGHHDLGRCRVRRAR